MSESLRLFDSHCHLDFPEFEGKVNSYIKKAIEAGIEGILIPGVTRAGWVRIRQLTARSAICHTALGLHPMFTKHHQESHLHDLEMALSVGPISAIGEIGLDYYKSDTNRHLQVDLFNSQMSIAKEAGLPVVLHVRKAHDEVLKILRLNNFTEGGIVHAFNGSEVQAKRFIERGFKLGFGGAMTYPRAVKLHQLASTLPLDSLVLETDAPDMPPVTCKTSHNTPLHLFDNFRSMVTLRHEPALKIADQLTQNVKSVLRIG